MKKPRPWRNVARWWPPGSAGPAGSASRRAPGPALFELRVRWLVRISLLRPVRIHTRLRIARSCVLRAARPRGWWS